MSEEDNIRLVHEFLGSHDPQLMAEGATYHDFTTHEPLRGRTAIGNLLDMLYHTGFPGATTEIRHVTASGEHVAVEYVFRGVNSGNLMGLPPTNRPVEIPMCGVFDVGNGAIQAARIYYDSAQLTRQLGLAPASAVR
jgi:predicted ester cyclase